jgi:hypothetical protein
LPLCKSSLSILKVTELAGKPAGNPTGPASSSSRSTQTKSAEQQSWPLENEKNYYAYIFSSMKTPNTCCIPIKVTVFYFDTLQLVFLQQVRDLSSITKLMDSVDLSATTYHLWRILRKANLAPPLSSISA